MPKSKKTQTFHDWAQRGLTHPIMTGDEYEARIALRDFEDASKRSRNVPLEVWDALKNDDPPE
jgi:hypothetical protein